MNECVEERILQRTSNSWNEGSNLYPLWKGREIKTCNLLYPVGLPREAWQPSRERLSTRNADRLLPEEQEMKRMGEEKRKFHVLLCMLLYHLNLWGYFTWVIIKRKHNGEKRKSACLEDHIFKTLEDFLTLSWPMGNNAWPHWDFWHYSASKCTLKPKVHSHAVISDILFPLAPGKKLFRYGESRGLGKGRNRSSVMVPSNEPRQSQMDRMHMKSSNMGVRTSACPAFRS